MPVTTIILLRHGHRLAWTLDPTTGTYTSQHPFPTKLPADPPLASHGVLQAKETGRYLSQTLFEAAKGDRLRIYSSLFYRCLETLRPTVELLQEALDRDAAVIQDGKHSHKQKRVLVRGERGVSEWFGHAWFRQPTPSTASTLKKNFFPWIDDTYSSLLIPNEFGERIEELHTRVFNALEAIVNDVDREFAEQGRGSEEVTVLICGHAAQIIATGRALTGEYPEDYDDEDFGCYTCGLSTFTRRGSQQQREGKEMEKTKGVAGGWHCIQNSDCSHLSQGAERGWHFHGDESFDSYGPGVLKTSDGSLDDEVTKRGKDASGMVGVGAKL